MSEGKHNFVSESINKFKMHPIVKTKGKIKLKLNVKRQKVKSS